MPHDEPSDECDRFEIKPKRLRGPRGPKLRIVHEDADLIVIDKPAGLDSVRGRFALDAVPDRLATLRGDDAKAFRIVHRLDRDASGIMVLARNVDAQRELTRQWAQGTVHKTYLAIVRGTVAPPEGAIDLPLSKTGNKDIPVTIRPRKGKPARTEYRVIKQYREFAVLEAVPLTGRMHQIRVHLAAAGMPIVADHHYGHTQALFLSQFKRAYRPSHREPQRPLIDRLALHAKRIAFRHPATDRETTLEADLPKDLRRTIAQLDRFG